MTPRSAIPVLDLLFRSLRTWRGVIAVFALVAQLGFLAHQTEHHLNFDLAASDDCALCHFGTSMTAPPEAAPLPIPAADFVAVTIRTPDTRTPRATVATAFRSRAPPVSHV
jgi:hypothetical protein